MLNYFSDIFTDDDTEGIVPIVKSFPSATHESPLSILPIDVSNIINTTIQCCTDYCKCLEHEKTERERISAQLEIRLNEIKSAKECVMQYLVNQEKKWSDVCRWIDKTLDRALENDDRKTVALCMTLAITGYQSDNSFKNLIDTQNQI